MTFDKVGSLPDRIHTHWIERIVRVISGGREPVKRLKPWSWLWDLHWVTLWAARGHPEIRLVRRMASAQTERLQKVARNSAQERPIVNRRHA
jgi:hypothetical protein